MLQKELAKRLKARYDTKMDGKGDFIIMKTGVHPMRVHLKLFFKWGIEFDDEHPYTVPDMGNREVKYADKKEIQDGILEKYPPEWKEETPAPTCRTEPLRYISISQIGRTRTASAGLPYRP